MKEKENNMDRWNFVRSFPYSFSKFIRGYNRFYDLVTIKQLLFDKAYQLSNYKKPHIRFGIRDFQDYEYILDRTYKKWKLPREQRKAFFNRYLYHGFFIILDRIMKEVIVKDGIFVFPKQQAFLFAAEMRPDHPYYKYDIKTDSGPVKIFLLVHPKFVRLKACVIVSLLGRYKEMLRQEIEKGHKYQEYSITIKNIHHDADKNILQPKLRLSRNDLGRHSGEV